MRINLLKRVDLKTALQFHKSCLGKESRIRVLRVRYWFPYILATALLPKVIPVTLLCKAISRIKGEKYLCGKPDFHLWHKNFQQDKETNNFIFIQRVRVENGRRIAHEQSSNANVHAPRNACESSKLPDPNIDLKLLSKHCRILQFQISSTPFSAARFSTCLQSDVIVRYTEEKEHTVKVRGTQ
jgi:hypothetical protein